MTKSYSNIKQHVGTSPNDFSNWNTMIDVYLEDSMHTNPVLLSNLKFWSKYVKVGGYIIGHDYHETMYPDVYKEFNKLIRNDGYRKVLLTETLIILRKHR